MRFIIIMAMSLLFKLGYSQKGTLLMTCVTEHGIVVATDSRGCFFDDISGVKTPIAYYDNACKIFKLGSFVISIAGANGIGETYFSSIITDFNREFPPHNNLEETFSSFIKYLDSKFPIVRFPERESNVFILSGYENGMPKIASFAKSKIDINHASTVISDSLAGKYYNYYNANPSLSVVDVIEQTMYSYAKGEKKEHLVGGPISFVLIKANNEVSWLKNDFSQMTFSNPMAFFNEIKEGRVVLHYLVPDGKPRLYKIFGE